MVKLTTQQAKLPFVMEDKVASREIIRQTSKNCDWLRKIDISKIRIRPGFNARRQKDMSDDLYEILLNIPMLAEGIYASNGPADALIGDIAVDGYFYIVEGERRFRALKFLLREHGKNGVYPNGEAIAEVRVVLTAPGTTDLQRKIMIGTSQDKLGLRPIDRAYYYHDLKTSFNLSHDEVAKAVNVSRQTVDIYIKATELPEDVQLSIDAGDISITDAIAKTRTKRKKMVEVDEETGEVTKEEDPTIRGDEDEFLQQDNSVDFPGSKGGVKEDKSSNEVVVGKDSIYMDQIDIAKWKQFLNRFRVIEMEVVAAEMLASKLSDSDLVDKRVIDRLRNEFTLHVK